MLFKANKSFELICNALSKLMRFKIMKEKSFYFSNHSQQTLFSKDFIHFAFQQ